MSDNFSIWFSNTFKVKTESAEKILTNLEKTSPKIFVFLTEEYNQSKINKIIIENTRQYI